MLRKGTSKLFPDPGAKEKSCIFSGCTSKAVHTKEVTSWYSKKCKVSVCNICNIELTHNGSYWLYFEQEDTIVYIENVEKFLEQNGYPPMLPMNKPVTNFPMAGVKKII